MTFSLSKMGGGKIFLIKGSNLKEPAQRYLTFCSPPTPFFSYVQIWCVGLGRCSNSPWFIKSGETMLFGSLCSKRGSIFCY